MLRGDATAASAETEVLGGEDVHDHNTFEQPDAVTTKRATATVSGKAVQFTLPPSSVTPIDDYTDVRMVDLVEMCRSRD